MAQRVPAPKDYSECYERYIDWIYKTVRNHGIDDVFGVSNDIFMRIIDKDLLGQYDPDRVFQTAVGPRTASFSAMLTKFVKLVVLDYKDKQHNLLRREPVRIDATLEVNSSTERIDLLVSEGLDLALIEGRIDYVRSVTVAKRHLSNLPIRDSRDRRRYLPDLFQFCIEQDFFNGGFSRKDVARHFKISDSAVFKLFCDLKAELKACGFYADLGGAT